MKCKIEVKYSLNTGIEFVAEIRVYLPKSTESSAEIAESLVDKRTLLARQELKPSWGLVREGSFRCSGPIELTADSLEGINKLVQAECLKIQGTLSGVYQRRLELTAQLPQNEVIEFDLDQPLVRSTTLLAEWRKQLEVDDEIACWTEESEMLEIGLIEDIDWHGNCCRLELRTKACDGSGFDIFKLTAKAEDILPAYCDRRSDAWRFEYKPGDILSWRNPLDPNIYRSDKLTDIQYDLADGSVELRWGEDTTVSRVNCMDFVGP